ncbi:hypothetical protein AXG93_2795s1020 [Marchantia polymorpha subsp. ruderalis]|uniref:Uncharacterized protein n=1 Tax=Marchantia polymorpha subsp. ruderalis TaxID=1480154 RepID=A0A176VDE7_MARPO|nr:hypothetical protein AXG93_2795s1020 [Marchantia polymorpha subsp. ruderalis]
MVRQRRRRAFGLQPLDFGKNTFSVTGEGTLVKDLQPKPEFAGSYVELVRSRTKAKGAERVASLTSKGATTAVTLQEREEQLPAKELECSELCQKLMAKENLRTQKKLECKDLRFDISNVQKVTVEL